MKISIDKFILFFRKEIECIKLYNSELHQKILYVALLDTLARVVYSPHNPSERFKKFIRNFSEWKDMDRVSVIQLKHRLDATLDSVAKGNSRLYIHVCQRNENFFPTANDVSIDELFDPISKLAQDKTEQNAITQSRYIELLYTYRNKLIHEYIEPGHAHELDGDDSAFYHSETLIELQKDLSEVKCTNKWQLCFPVAMFEKLCNTCLDNLHKHLIANRIDPYSKFDFGDNWDSD